MKSNVVILLISSLYLSSIVIGCDNTRQDQPVRQSTNIPAKDIEVRKTIERINQLLSKAVIANDYETQLRYFSENAIIEPPLGPEVTGKAGIQRGFENNAKDNVVFHSHSTTIEELWVCGDKVYEKGKWGMSQSSNKSKTPMAFHGSYFVMWKLQQDTSCVIDYIIFNLHFNPYEGQR